MTFSADSLQHLLLQQQVRKYLSTDMSLFAVLLKIWQQVNHLLVLDLLTLFLKMMQSQLLGLGGVVDAGVLRLKDRENQSGDYQALQARIIQLEGQVCECQHMWHFILFTLTLYLCSLKLTCYYPGEDPAAWARPVPNVARECPAAA